MARARNAEFECPRCGQIATGPAVRRGTCTGCGAELVSARRPTEERVRAYLYGPERLPPAAGARRLEGTSCR